MRRSAEGSLPTATRRFAHELGALLMVGCLAVASACGQVVASGSRATYDSKSTLTSDAKTPQARAGSSVVETTVQPTTSTTSTVPRCSTAGWPVAQRAAVMVFASLKVADVNQVRDAVQRGVGGVFLGTGAVGLLGSVDFAQALASASDRPFVAVDEEGGRVQRIASVIGDMPSPRVMQRTMSAAQVSELAHERGVAMRNLGVTMDFAPVADVSSQPDDGPIGDRSFSADAKVATTDAVAFAQGLASAGVRPVFKHFPGHGRAEGNSHDGLVTTPSLASLQSSDLLPYKTGLSQVPTVSVMVGHLIVPGLTDGQPASVSHQAITDLLRDQLGFGGLVITDDLGLMRGILDLYTTQQAAVRAAMAGADLLLVPEPDVGSVIQGLVDAVDAGQLPASQVTASADRVLTAQGIDACR